MKGSINKTTARTRRALEACFEQLGGVPALVEWALENSNTRGEFYRLWARLALLPTEPPGSRGERPIRVVFGGRYHPERPAPDDAPPARRPPSVTLIN